MLMKYCQEKRILYIDTSNEEVDDFYKGQHTLADKCNYTLREHLKEAMEKTNQQTTSISCCGANPGMVCWLVKQALLNIAKDTGYII